jgi:hypothetical protein
MKFRQTDMLPVAAAKASFSSSTGYRFESDPRLLSQKKEVRGRRRSDPLVNIFDGRKRDLAMFNLAIDSKPTLFDISLHRVRAAAQFGRYALLAPPELL